MRSISEVLASIGTAPDFAGVAVVDSNTRGHCSTYPLHVAAVSGDCEAIQMLVAAGARLEQQGEHGYTPLMEAVAQGNAEAAELLISFGAKATPNEDGEIPSSLAAILGNDRLSQMLKSKGY